MQTKVCLILIAALCLLSAACTKEKASGAVPENKTTDEWVQGIGYIEPASEVRRLAFKYPGVIAECRVEAGQMVKKGDVLMRLNDREERASAVKAEAMVALARAELAQTIAGVNPARIRAQKATLDAARAESDYAQRNLQRQKKLHESGGANSESDRDLAEMQAQQKEALSRQSAAELEHLEHYVRMEDLAVMEAKVKQAEAQLAEAQAMVDEMELKASFDGTVLEVLQREGNAAYTAYPEPVIVFGDLTKMRVRAEIDETYALRIKQGQSVLIRTRDEGRTEVRGTVVLVKQMMGKKTVFAKTATERKDLDVLQVLMDLPSGTSLPVGLEVDVQVLVKQGQ